MTDAALNPDDYCYRHPDRPSFVLCERCGRTICLECQHHQDGHVYCPDDAQARVTQLNSARSARSRRVRRSSTLLSRISPGTPIVTYAIMAILVVLFLANVFTRGALTNYLIVQPGGVLRQPWTLVTSMFYVADVINLLLSGVNLYFIGRFLEPQLGRYKYIVLYIVSGFGAAVFAFLLDGAVVSPYGAVVGLIASLVVTARRMGGNPIYLYVICAISAVLAIVLGGWQAFLGGFIAGGLVTLIYLYEGDARRVARARALLVLLGAVLVLLAFARAIVFLGT
jgi:membrane associated rhomboid family serine protease